MTQRAEQRVRSAFLTILFLGIVSVSRAANIADLEIGHVWPGYNDVAVPGDTGTRFSLTDDLQAEDTWAVRFRFGREWNERHLWAVLIAPLTVKSTGKVDKDIRFKDVVFPAETDLDATYRFNSYRLIYRYTVYQSGKWRWRVGVAGKIRDAEIRIESQEQSASKTDLGFVPLLSFDGAWMPLERLHFVVDGEALEAPQGRAADILFAGCYQITSGSWLKAGYRILEGGADNDDVYAFAAFHYFVVGLTIEF